MKKSATHPTAKVCSCFGQERTRRAPQPGAGGVPESIRSAAERLIRHHSRPVDDLQATLDKFSGIDAAHPLTPH